MWNNKCPRCRQGKIFTEPLDFKNPLSMPARCQYCDLRTEPEPGFYYGALMVSYIVSSFMLLSITLLLVFYFGWSENAAFGLMLFLAVISYLKILRGSRSMWLHLMVKHDPNMEDAALREIQSKAKKAENWKPRTH